ncbi:hypothetical protein [Streptomyces sp. GC420]|uniref:hypothetical protein n=1 Tax=Streptomyces sp. GC420 TaxID=2697568 RepID=UPI0014151933|nr:hypothetical protein [Streptomyces sp. GC420]
MHIGRNPSAEPDLEELTASVARGDPPASSRFYDVVAGSVLGIARSVLRDRVHPAEASAVRDHRAAPLDRTPAYDEAWRRRRPSRPGRS